MKLVSGIFGGMKAQKVNQTTIEREIAPAKTPLMPSADDEASARAKRNSIAAQQNRTGRQSTIMSGGDEEKLGA